MLGALIQIDGWDPVAAAAVTLTACSVDDPALCHVAGQTATWLPAIAKLPALRYDLFDGAFTSAITSPTSSLALQIEPWPNFGRYILANARLRLWTGEVGDPFSAFTLRMDGRISTQPETADGQASIDFGVDDGWLDSALLVAYSGTTGAEGVAGLKGQAKPLSLGAPRYVAGQLIDPANSVFQVSAYGAIQGIEAALERLARFPAAVADYADYASLVAATIPAGQWATCLAQGLARFGAPPTGQISFLVQGDAAGPNGWARLPGQIIRRLALLSGGSGRIDDASLNALDAARPYPLSLYLDGQTTARELVQKLAASVNAVAGVSWTGQLFVAPVGVGTPTTTLAADGSALPPVSKVKQVANDAPWRKLALGAARCWTVHALTDIAFAATLTDRGAYAAATSYREGDVVTLADGSRWLHTGATPTKGVAPGSDATAWTALAGAPIVNWDAIADPNGTKPQAGATRNVPQGDYDNTVQFQAGDLVNNQNAVWSCLAATKGNPPPTLPTKSNSWWTLFIQAGDSSAALAEIARINSDGWLTAGEKPTLIRDVQAIQQEYSGTVQLAQSQGISTTNYSNAYSKLLNDLSGLNPAWNDTSKDTQLSDSTLLPNDFSSYYSQKATLDLGTGTGLLNQLGVIASDAWLSRGEKPSVIQDWNVISGEAGPLSAQAAALGLSGSAAQANLDNARGNLSNYLANLSPAWNDTTKDTPITGGTFLSYFTAYYSARTALLNAMTAAATQAATPTNRVRLSQFEAGTTGWAIRFQNGGTIKTGLNTSTYQGKPYLGVQMIPSGANQGISLGPTDGYKFAVTPGDAMACSVGFQTYGPCSYQQINVYFFDSTGAQLNSFPSIQRSGTHGFNDKFQFFFTVPAGAVLCRFEAFAFSSGAGSSSNFLDMALTEPMVCSVSIGQTVFPAFVPGPNATDGADVTGNNTAKDTTNVGGTPSATVLQNIATAQSTASDAKTASAAGASMAADIADNSKFSKDEKKRYYQQITSWAGSGSGSIGAIVNQLNAFGLTGPATTLNNAWSSFYSYLQQVHYSDLSSSDGINRSYFRSTEASFSDALTGASQALTNYQSNLSVQTAANLFTDSKFLRLNSSADWAQVTLNNGAYSEASSDGQRVRCPGGSAHNYLKTVAFPVSDGDRIDVKLDLYCQNVSSGGVRIKVDLLDNNLNLQNTAQFWDHYGNDGYLPQNQWTNAIAGSVVAYGGCAYARIYIETYNTDGTMYLRNPQGARVPNAVRNLDATGRQTSALLTSGYAVSGSLSATGLSMSGSGSTINISNFSVDFGDGYQSISGASISGLNSGNIYYVWLLAPNMNNNGRSFSVSTSFTGQGDKQRILLGSVNLMTGGSSGGSSSSGGVSGDRCVAADMWLRDGLRARDAAVGTAIDLLRRDWLGHERAPITGILAADADCVELVTERGARLICSRSTPIELPCGRVIRAPEAAWATVASEVDGQFHPDDRVVAIYPAGVRPVMKIHAGDRVYAAGTRPGARIFTHNVLAKP